MRNHSDNPRTFSRTFRDSLDTISATHVRLNLLAGTCATPALIASKIKLCDLLLDELAEIHTGLGRHLEHTHKAPGARLDP
jgi:hypothetical protein